jgi:hypothetical protein
MAEKRTIFEALKGNRPFAAAGVVLRTKREAAGITIARLAGKYNMGTDFIREIEDGRIGLSQQRFLQFGAEFSFSRAYYQYFARQYHLEIPADVKKRFNIPDDTPLEGPKDEAIIPHKNKIHGNRKVATAPAQQDESKIPSDDEVAALDPKKRVPTLFKGYQARSGKSNPTIENEMNTSAFKGWKNGTPMTYSRLDEMQEALALSDKEVVKLIWLSLRQNTNRNTISVGKTELGLWLDKLEDKVAYTQYLTETFGSTKIVMDNNTTTAGTALPTKNVPELLPGNTSFPSRSHS